MKTLTRRGSAALLMGLAWLGCAPVPPQPSRPIAEQYLPLRVGASWVYKVTDTGVTLNKTTSVEVYEDIGGSKAGIKGFRVKSDDTTGYSVSWQEDDADRVYRWRDQSFNTSAVMTFESYYTPGKLRLDQTAPHLVVGVTWTETFSENLHDLKAKITTTADRSEDWTVVAVDEAMTVPGGTFTCLHLKKVSVVSGVTGTKEYWYAKGVGKVKEIGLNRVEELVSFSFPK